MSALACTSSALAPSRAVSGSVCKKAMWLLPSWSCVHCAPSSLRLRGLAGGARAMASWLPSTHRAPCWSRSRTCSTTATGSPPYPTRSPSSANCSAPCARACCRQASRAWRLAWMSDSRAIFMGLSPTPSSRAWLNASLQLVHLRGPKAETPDWIHVSDASSSAVRAELVEAKALLAGSPSTGSGRTDLSEICRQSGKNSCQRLLVKRWQLFILKCSLRLHR